MRVDDAQVQRDRSGLMPVAIPVAVSGFGSVGKTLARRLLAGIPGFELVAIGSRDPERTRRQVEEALRCDVPVLDSRVLNGCAKILLECAPAVAFRGIAEPALISGMTVVTISAAALLDNLDLEDIAARGKGRIVLASGAIAGLDAIKAARLDKITSVRMITRKPPQSLARTSWMQSRNIDARTMTDAVCVFSGTARDAARQFPANANVAAAVSLAGAGPDLTMVEIWADPAVERNTHSVYLDSDAARIEVKIANFPSADNPATSRIAALSMLATLISLTCPLSIGT
jgi:aspartate dehydrogenase